MATWTSKVFLPEIQDYRVPKNQSFPIMLHPCFLRKDESVLLKCATKPKKSIVLAEELICIWHNYLLHEQWILTTKFTVTQKQLLLKSFILTLKAHDGPDKF